MQVNLMIDTIEHISFQELENIDTNQLKENGLYELFIVIIEKAFFGIIISKFDKNYYSPILNVISEFTLFKLNFFDFENSRNELNNLYENLTKVIENEKMNKKTFEFLVSKKYQLEKIKTRCEKFYVREIENPFDNIFHVLYLVGEYRSENPINPL